MSSWFITLIEMFREYYPYDSINRDTNGQKNDILFVMKNYQSVQTET